MDRYDPCRPLYRPGGTEVEFCGNNSGYSSDSYTDLLPHFGSTWSSGTNIHFLSPSRFQIQMVGSSPNLFFELATPLGCGAHEMARYGAAGLEIMTSALERFNEERPAKLRLRLYRMNGTVGYEPEGGKFVIEEGVRGFHQSLTISRSLFKRFQNASTAYNERGLPSIEDAACRRCIEFVLLFRAARGTFIGNGGIFPHPDRPDCFAFRFSQRKFPREITSTSTSERPLIHVRGEAHAADVERDHDIALNSMMSEWQQFLVAITSDLVFLMAADDEFVEEDHLAFLYENPRKKFPYADAGEIWDGDLSAEKPCMLIRTERGEAHLVPMTWLDVLEWYAERGEAFLRRYPELKTWERSLGLSLWRQITAFHREHDYVSLGQYLDWASIHQNIYQPFHAKHGLTEGKTPYSHVLPRNDRPVIAHLLHLRRQYFSLDRTAGFYWRWKKQGAIRSLFRRRVLEAAMNRAPRTRERAIEQACHQATTLPFDSPPTIQAYWDKVIARGSYMKNHSLTRTVLFPDPLRPGETPSRKDWQSTGDPT
jgi:hypothetical protein